MASEKTIAKNVPSLKKLIINYTNLGPIKYNPSQVYLKIEALTTLHDNAALAQKALNEEEITYRNVAGDREELFKPLDKLITRCLRIFQLSEASETIQDGIKTIADKARGVDNRDEPEPPTDPEMTPEEQKHSVIQRSYVMRAENFSRFIIMLDQEPTYLPDSPDQQVAALETLLATLIAKNEETDAAFDVYRTKMADRDKIFFEKDTGLVDIALKSKKYVSGKFGMDSVEYIAIRSIAFARKTKKKKKAN